MKRFVPLLLTFCAVLHSSGRDETPFPHPASKKGLQVQMVDDALSLGIKHAALNVNIGQLLLAPKETNGLESAVSKQWRFSPAYVSHLDQQVKTLSDHGVVVSFILLNYAGGNLALNKLLLHPKYHPAAPNHLSAFNTTTPEGREAFRACVEFVAERYSGQNHGRVWNYIVGNEVNSHWFWCNLGHVAMEEFADDYLKSVRLCHESVRKHSANARVYLSLEHHWNMHYPGGDETQTFAGWPFLKYFAKRARESGDFDWHLAFHPYPENLFNCETWNDKSATLTTNTPRITFRNLEMLPRFMGQPDILYRGEPRRIILSEQGFHSKPTQDGERLQAAAYCYAYFKVAQLEEIDGFIYHRHVDHGQEGGLNLGLWSRNKASKNPAEPASKKLIFEVFRAADTDDWQSSFRFALPIIGVSSWSDILAPASQ